MTYHSIPLLGCCTSGKWIATHESKRNISHKSMVYTMVFTTYFIHLHLWKLGILGDHLLVFVIQYTLYIHYILGLYHGYPPIRPQSWLISWSIVNRTPHSIHAYGSTVSHLIFRQTTYISIWWKITTSPCCFYEFKIWIPFLTNPWYL